MISGSYDFLNHDRVIFGRPAKEAIPETAAKLGKSRVMIVSSKSLNRNTSAITEIKTALGSTCVGVYDECAAHSPRSSVLALADAMRAANPDLIATIGGGSPMDSVRVALMCLAHGISDEAGFDRIRIRVDENGKAIPVPDKPSALRQIIVPTTLSAAEFSDRAGVTDPARKVKDLYHSRDTAPQVIILDPAITLHTPLWLWLSSGLRAVDHAVETICSIQPQPFTDATCLHGLAHLALFLRMTKKDPSSLDARLHTQLAVWLAATGIGRILWGASHGIGHQLGAVAHVPHGHCSCIMLPNVLRYNASTNGERQMLVSNTLDRADMSAADAIAELVTDLGQPTRLRDVGVTREQFDPIIEGAMQNMHVRANPRPITSPAQVREILEMAF